MHIDHKVNKPVPKRKLNENITKKLSSVITSWKNEG